MPLREGGNPVTGDTPCIRQGITNTRSQTSKGRRYAMYSVEPIGWWMRMWWGSQYFTPVIA